MFHKRIKIFITLIVCLFAVSSVATASGVKERMIARLPVIADLKARGIIGEGNNGYLGYVTGQHEKEDVISAENKDRRAVYSYFAQQQNTTLAVVEKVQAKRKAEKAKPGEFIQTPDGAWVKK